MATNTWNVDANGDWSTAANWSAGLPTSSQDVVISTANIRTITHNSGTDTVKSLTVGNDHFSLNGGSLEILTTATFSLDYTQTGGSLLGTASVTVNGAGTLIGGYAGNTIAFHIGGTISLANYTLGGAVTLTNNATTNETGQVTLGDNTGVNATITNSASGTYNISVDNGIGAGAISAKFINAGVLRKSAGNGTSIIAPNITETGTITVSTGTLQFNGASNSFNGTINGAGQFAIGGGGANTFASTLVLSSGSFGLYDSGTSLTLGANLTYSGTFTQAFGTTLNLAGKQLTLNGTAAFLNQNFGTPTVNGSGVLFTKGTTTVNIFVLGGSVDWLNGGTVNEIAGLQIGDSSGLVAGFTNGNGGVFNITADVGIARGVNASDFFDNVGGTLAKTGGSGTSLISASFSDTSNAAAMIQVGSGTLQFDGATNTFINQTISGAGQFAIGGGGSNTIAAGTTITTGTFGLYDSGTIVTLGESLTYAGTYVQEFGTTLNLAGNTLTLSGPATFANQNFGTPTVNGSGTVNITGTTLIANFVLGGSVTMKNTGTVNQTQTLQIGDSSGQANRFANSTGGTYNIVNDSGITAGANAASNFNNNGGTLAKTGGVGTSTILASFLNNSGLAAAIQIASGTLQFTGATNNFVGQAITGAGNFQIAGGSSTIGTGTTIASGSFNIVNGGTVTLGETLSYTGNFSLQYGTTLNLGANSFNLSGTSLFANQNFGTPLITGSGKINVAGTTTVSFLNIGGTAVFKNLGTVLETGTIQVGDNSGQAASITNVGGTIFNLTTDAGISHGASSASVFNNNGGTLIKSAGTGTSVISVLFNNATTTAGKVEVASGTLDFAAAVTGAANAFKIDAGTRLEFDSSVVSSASVAFNGAGSALQMSDAQDFAGTISGFGAASGQTLDLRSIGFGSNTTLGYANNGTSGVLTVSDGTHTAHLALLGQYTQTEFSKNADGNGGTAITFAAPASASLTTPHHG